MTLRILERGSEHEAVIELHGWLSAAEVTEVERLAGERASTVRIDLTQLAGVDMPGLEALRRLQASGARLTGMTPYIELLLQRLATGGAK